MGERTEELEQPAGGGRRAAGAYARPSAGDARVGASAGQEAGASPVARRPFLDHSLVQLTLVRYREFLREPEAVFWTFVFPILLAAGLGLAFRSRPPEVAAVGVVTDAGALAPAELAALAAQPGLRVQRFPSEAAADSALATGTLALVAEAAPAEGGGRAARYRFDPERPDARTARLLVDRAVQRGAGRQDALAVREAVVREPGSRYMDFFIPGCSASTSWAAGSGGWGSRS
jgi:hypothetical protein